MTEPVWDGQGRDPWLPARLDARLEAAEMERDIRAALWSALSEWLVALERRLLRSGASIDLTAVWSMEPAWREAVDLIIRGEIFQAVALAFRKIFGPDYPVNERPAINRYLTEVRNRMVRTPDEVYDLVAGEIAAGANLGESLPKLRDRVDTVLSTTATERWPNRATVVARTETIGALNAGKMDAYRAIVEDDPDTRYEVIWLATDDRRTRKSHDKADGQRVPFGSPFTVGGFSLAFPGDPTGPPQEVIQCVPADTVVDYPGLRSAFRRWYQGEMITVEFSSGDHLTITPNHPVLRADGEWIPAGHLQEGDQCIRCSGGRWTLAEPHPHHGPAQIGEVYRAACLTTVPNRVPLTPPDLHGDRPYGYVEVVPADGYLDLHGEPATDEKVRQFGLATADLARLLQGHVDCGEVAPGVTGAEVDGSSSGHMSGLGDGTALGGGSPIEPYRVGFAGRPDFQTERGQFANDGGSAGVEVPGHLQHTVTPVISLTQVIRVNRHTFSGHVFNLDTGHGWYSANSIITRNCRCTPLLVEHGESVDLSNRQMRS